MFRLFKKSGGQYVKLCHVYLPRHGQKSVIAATYNHGGLYAEYVAVECDIQSEIFEQTITQQFDACIYKADFNYHNRKKSDWPAFIISACKSIEKFERDYMAFSIQGANERNIILCIESPELQNGIKLKSSLSASYKASQLKERLLSMHQLFLKLEDLASGH